jgi:diadenosine tetraphosphate (Ap4A) HIT family hydrolase
MDQTQDSRLPHFHVHIIPKRKGDLGDRGGSDAVYGVIEGEEGNTGKYLNERNERAQGWDRTGCGGEDAEE